MEQSEDDLKDLEAAVIKWEIHHGSDVYLDIISSKSIEKIVDDSISIGCMNINFHQKHVDFKTEKLNTILTESVTNNDKPESEKYQLNCEFSDFL